MKYLFLFAAALCFADSVAFVPSSSKPRQTSALAMARLPTPTFNKETEKWEKAKSDDGVYPYDAVGSLLRHGPSPFIARTFSPENYEQQVLKYMAVAKVDRAEATGNMDAKLNNAADWAYRKMEEKKGARKVDYTYLDRKQAALTITWAVIILPTVYYVFEKTISEVLNH